MGRYTTLEEEIALIKKRAGIKLNENEVKPELPKGKEIITSDIDKESDDQENNQKKI